MTEFMYMSQELDGEVAVIRVPVSAQSVWLPRGFAPCEAPQKRVREAASPDPGEAPAPAVKAPKKAPLAGPESKTEGPV